VDAAHFSAFAALAGSSIGGVTVVATSWLTQHAQLRAQRREHDLTRRESLYRSFIEEACTLYADAFEHDVADASKVVNRTPWSARCASCRRRQSSSTRTRSCV
jgi:hypothetical protein